MGKMGRGETYGRKKWAKPMTGENQRVTNSNKNQKSGGPEWKGVPKGRTSRPGKDKTGEGGSN